MRIRAKVQCPAYRNLAEDLSSDAEECRETEATWLPITWKSLPPFRPPIHRRLHRPGKPQPDPECFEKGVALELVYVSMEEFTQIYAGEVGMSSRDFRAILSDRKGGFLELV